MITKILFAFFLVVMVNSPATSVYDIAIQPLNGTMLSLSTFKGKKIVVIEFDANNYDKAQLLMLDSFQRSNAQIRVIAVPAKDFSPSTNSQRIVNLSRSLNLSFIMTQPALIKKASGSNQEALFRWLTHSSNNNHFDGDVDQPGQIYLINEKGILYGVLYYGTS